jgi:hypothetical protein
MSNNNIDLNVYHSEAIKGMVIWFDFWIWVTDIDNRPNLKRNHITGTYIKYNKDSYDGMTVGEDVKEFIKELNEKRNESYKNYLFPYEADFRLCSLYEVNEDECVGGYIHQR